MTSNKNSLLYGGSPFAQLSPRWKSPRVDATGTEWPLEERIAFHAAGHAVIARTLGVSVSSVTIEQEGSISGQVRYSTSNDTELGAVLQTELDWRERDTPERTFEKLLPSREALIAHILIGLAGAAAESYFCGGVICSCARKDNADIKRLMRLFPCHRATMKRTAEMLVQCHRGTILRVACNLIASSTLSGLQLDEAIDGPDF
jgi:hypothetical protein